MIRTFALILITSTLSMSSIAGPHYGGGHHTSSHGGKVNIQIHTEAATRAEVTEMQGLETNTGHTSKDVCLQSFHSSCQSQGIAGRILQILIDP